jgi:hypothetical protein
MQIKYVKNCHPSNFTRNGVITENKKYFNCKRDDAMTVCPSQARKASSKSCLANSFLTKDPS